MTGGAERPGDTDASAAPRSAAPALPSPTTRYTTGEELGSGGMGRVVAVTDHHLGRVVARKVLKGDPTSGRAARFWREVQVTAGLEHPAIPPVYDAGQGPDGAPWYDMRLVDGETLASVIAARPALADRLALVPAFLTVCQAVAWAHDHGVVHRDLKPGNVLLGRYGETWVIDWGLASGDADTSHDPRLTHAGDLLGTPAYLSPEAARGEAIAEAADVWGLGAILHELLTAEPPWGADTRTSLVQRARAGARPPWPPSTPPALAAIADRCLEPNPADRYRRAADVAADVAAWQEGRWVGAYRYPLREAAAVLARRHRAGLAAALVATAVIVVSALASWRVTVRERDRAVDAEAVLLEQLALRAAEADAWLEAAPLAAAALRHGDRPDARGVLIHAAAGPRPRLVSSWHLPVACRRVIVSPDGAHAACEEDRRLSLWRLDPVALTAAVDGAPNGTAWANGDTLRTIIGWRSRLLHVDGSPAPGLAPPGDRSPNRVDGGWATVEAGAVGVWWDDRPPELARPCGDDGRISLADATATAFLAACVDDPTWLSGPRGGPAVRATTPIDPRTIAAIAWSPAGDRLLAGARDGRLWWLDPSGAPIGPAYAVLPSVRSVGVAADGSFAWAASDAGAFALIDPSGGPSPGRLPASAEGLASDVGGPWTYRVDPTGTRLDRWAIRPDPAGRRDGPWGLAGVCASPDGQRLATPRGDGALALWGPTGGPSVIPGPAGVLKRCAFSADGRAVFAGGVGAPVVWRVSGDRVDALATPGLIKRVATTAEGLTLGFTYSDGWVAWDGDAVVATDRPPGVTLLEVATTPAGEHVHAAWSDGTITAWDTSARRFRPLVDAPATTLAVHPDLGLVTLESDLVTVRSLADGHVVRSWPAAADLETLATNGAWVAGGTVDGAVLLWTGEGALTARIPAGPERVAQVTFAGPWLTSAGWDGALRVWPITGLAAPAPLLGVDLADAMTARPR